MAKGHCHWIEWDRWANGSDLADLGAAVRLETLYILEPFASEGVFQREA